MGGGILQGPTHTERSRGEGYDTFKKIRVGLVLCRPFSDRRPPDPQAGRAGGLP